MLRAERRHDTRSPPQCRSSNWANASQACTHRYAYVSIRQHTSAYVSIRQHTSAYVSIRQHTSAYVSIRQHTPAYVSIAGMHAQVCIRQHTSAYVSIRQHTSAYVSIRSASRACTRRSAAPPVLVLKYLTLCTKISDLYKQGGNFLGVLCSMCILEDCSRKKK
jgi:hypothetical protein